MESISKTAAKQPQISSVRNRKLLNLYEINQGRKRNDGGERRTKTNDQTTAKGTEMRQHTW
jgi:hypothetical protein